MNSRRRVDDPRAIIPTISIAISPSPAISPMDGASSVFTVGYRHVSGSHNLGFRVASMASSRSRSSAVLGAADAVVGAASGTIGSNLEF